jgi:hypothetical protein
MKQHQIPHQVRDVLIYGQRGDFRIKIDGEPLETRQGHEHRFASLDSAARLMARHGQHRMQLEVSDV